MNQYGKYFSIFFNDSVNRRHLPHFYFLSTKGTSSSHFSLSKLFSPLFFFAAAYPFSLH